jgi:hypothetical protein
MNEGFGPVDCPWGHPQMCLRFCRSVFSITSVISKLRGRHLLLSEPPVLRLKGFSVLLILHFFASREDSAPDATGGR